MSYATLLWQAERRAGWQGLQEPVVTDTTRDRRSAAARQRRMGRFKKRRSGNRRGPRPKSFIAPLVDALDENVVVTRSRRVDREASEGTKNPV
jgi:hypothetical protein